MNSTILATILVLFSSIGLGVVTGLISFKLGSESLKGVQSPQENPTQKISAQELEQLDLTQKKKFQIIEEKTILIKVYNHTHQQRKVNQAQEKESLQ